MMSSKRKPPGCFSGEPRSTSGINCDGLDEREAQKLPHEDPLAEIAGDDCGVKTDIPIDRGWAWVICAGCFAVTYIMSLYDQVLAVMFVDVVDKFNVPVSTATVVFTIQAVTFSAGSVISTNIIVPKFGVRVVIVTAAIANSLSTVIIAFSPNITFYLIFHLFKGLSIGSMWIPALGLLGHYFQRCRSVATSITNAGISVSLLITPIFVRELLDNVGFSGTLLIISGVEMQAVAIGMLLRPPSRYAKKTPRTFLDPHNFQNKGEHEQYSLLDTTRDTDVRCKTTAVVLTEGICSCGVLGSNISDQQFNQQVYNTSDSQPEDNSRLESVRSYDEPLVRAEEKSVNIDQMNAFRPTEDARLNSTAISEPGQFSDSYIHNSNCPVLRQYQNINLLEKCRPDMKISEIHTKRKSHSSVENQRNQLCLILRGLFDLNLLGDWLMRILLASTVLGALLQYIPTYIPTLAVQKGLDKTSAAVLLTICGGVNLVSTLLQGFVIDAKVITAARFVAICQVIVGTMCHLTHVFTSFPTLVLLSVTQGLFGGSRMSLMPVVAMDFVGVNNLSKALGFNAMIATLSLSLHHPFLGYLVQRTSSFVVPFHYVGFALYVSAGLLLLEPCGRNLNSRRTHRDHDN